MTTLLLLGGHFWSLAPVEANSIVGLNVNVDNSIRAAGRAAGDINAAKSTPQLHQREHGAESSANEIHGTPVTLNSFKQGKCTLIFFFHLSFLLLYFTFDLSEQIKNITYQLLSFAALIIKVVFYYFSVHVKRCLFNLKANIIAI